MSPLKNFLCTEVVDVMRGFILPCPQVAWLHSISGIVVVIMQLNVLKVMDSVVKPISVSICGLFNPSSEVPDFVANILILIVIYVGWCKKALLFWPQILCSRLRRPGCIHVFPGLIVQTGTTAFT